MTSELRPAVEVWRQAHQALYWLPKGAIGEQGAAAVIEADREAVRAPLLAEIERLTIQLEVESGPSPYCPICGSCGEDGCCGPQRCLYPTTEQAAELAKFKALAETLAGALEEWDELIKHPYFGSREAMSDMNYAAQRGLKALRQYKEAANV